MQIIGSVQIVTFVTSVAPTFCAALRFWVFFFCLALLLLLLYLLDCAGVFRSCGSDHGLCPLDSHKPLKRLDRNFYMGFARYYRPRRKRFLQLTAKLKPPPPKKIKKHIIFAFDNLANLFFVCYNRDVLYCIPKGNNNKEENLI